MKNKIIKILKESTEIDTMFKIMINKDINPIFYFSIQDYLIDVAGYDWSDVDQIVEAHQKYFKLKYNMDFTPYNFLTAFFNHMTPNKKYLNSDKKIFYEKNGNTYFINDFDNKVFYFDFENVWNKISEIFGLSQDEIKKITKSWISKELGLKRYTTHYWN